MKNTFLILLAMTLNFVLSGQEQMPEQSTEIIGKIRTLYKKDGAFLNAGQLDKSRKNHWELYANVLALEDTYLTLPERLDKGVAMQSKLLNRAVAGNTQDEMTVEQNAVNHIVGYSLNEFNRPQARQPMSPVILQGVRDDLIQAGISSMKALQDLSGNAPLKSLRENQDNALYFLKQALDKVRNERKQQQKNNKNQPKNQDGDDQNQAKNQDGAGKDQTKNKNDLEKNQGGEKNNDSGQNQEKNNSRTSNNAVDGSNRKISDAMRQSMDDISKYEEYKQQARRQRLKSLGLSEDDVDAFVNPRLPVEKDW